MPLPDLQIWRSDIILQLQNDTGKPKALGILALLAFLFAWLVSIRSKRNDLLNIPLLTNEDNDFANIMAEGYRNFRDKLFKIPTSNYPMLIVPTSMLDELKSFPVKAISFRQEMYDRYLGKYTAVASNSDGMVDSVKNNLTRGLSQILPHLKEEAEYAVQDSLGDTASWERVNIYGASTRMIALMSGRVFVGLPLSRNEDWVRNSIGITMSAFSGATQLYRYPSFLWPIVRHFIPQTIAVKKHRRETEDMLEPLVNNRLRDMENPKFVKPEDMLQWLIDNSKGRGNDVPFQANEHLVVNIAAIHTTGGQLAQTLFDLARFPQYITPLREEIAKVFAQNDAATKQSLSKLSKLDSFIKEGQRMNPSLQVTVNRKILQPVTLSNGVTLPKGTSVAASAACVNKDPAIFENPEEFDGFRYHNLRQKEGNEAKYQFATIGSDALSFGHGRHACPGRFFASAEIKVLLCYLLMNYDIRQPEDSKGPLYVLAETIATPDPTLDLEFKRRDSAIAPKYTE